MLSSMITGLAVSAILTQLAVGIYSGLRYTSPGNLHRWIGPPFVFASFFLICMLVTYNVVSIKDVSWWMFPFIWSVLFFGSLAIKEPVITHSKSAWIDSVRTKPIDDRLTGGAASDSSPRLVERPSGRLPR